VPDRRRSRGRAATPSFHPSTAGGCASAAGSGSARPRDSDDVRSVAVPRRLLIQRCGAAGGVSEPSTLRNRYQSFADAVENFDGPVRLCFCTARHSPTGGSLSSAMNSLQLA